MKNAPSNIILGDLIFNLMVGRKRSIRKLLFLFRGSCWSHLGCHSPLSRARQGKQEMAWGGGQPVSLPAIVGTRAN